MMKKTVFIVLLLVLVLMISCSPATSAAPSAQNQNQSAAGETSSQNNAKAFVLKGNHVFGSGEYIVGGNMPPGEYIFLADLEDNNADEYKQIEIINLAEASDDCEGCGLVYETASVYDIITLESGWEVIIDGYYAQPLDEYFNTTDNLITINNIPDGYCNPRIFLAGTMVDPGYYLLTPQTDYGFYGVGNNTQPLTASYMGEEVNPDSPRTFLVPEGTYLVYNDCIVEPIKNISKNQKKALQFSGVYSGTYENNSGKMMVEIFLMVTDPDKSQASAIVNFWPAPNNTKGKAGCYEMSGYIDLYGGGIDMFGMETWRMDMPDGYEMLDFSGEIANGTLYGVWDREYMAEFEASK